MSIEVIRKHEGNPQASDDIGRTNFDDQTQKFINIQNKILYIRLVTESPEAAAYKHF